MMRKSQMVSSQHGFGGVDNEQLIVPPAQQRFETVHSPDLDPQLSSMLTPEEYSSLIEQRKAMNGIKPNRHQDQVQANQIQQANLKAMQRVEAQKQGQMGRRARRQNNSIPISVPKPALEEFSLGRATPVSSQRQERDGRHRSSTGVLPIAPPASEEVQNNLLNGTTWGPSFQERGTQPMITSSLGVNLRPENLSEGRELVAVQPLAIGQLPDDILDNEEDLSSGQPRSVPIPTLSPRGRNRKTKDTVPEDEA